MDFLLPWCFLHGEGAGGEMKKLLTQLDQGCQKPGIKRHVNPGKNRHLEKTGTCNHDLGMVVMAEEFEIEKSEHCPWEHY